MDASTDENLEMHLLPETDSLPSSRALQKVYTCEAALSFGSRADEQICTVHQGAKASAGTEDCPKFFKANRGGHKQLQKQRNFSYNFRSAQHSLRRGLLACSLKLNICNS